MICKGKDLIAIGQVISVITFPVLACKQFQMDNCFLQDRLEPPLLATL